MATEEFVQKEPIAIIGLGCVLPDAPDVATFWSNILAGKNSIREVPKERWDPALYYSTDKAAPYKTYAKIGAFVADDAFKPLDYRVLPTAMEQIDPSQRWALAAARQALKDAGYSTGIKADGGKDFDRGRCGVILGNAMGGEQMKLQTKNIYWNQVEAVLRADPAFQKLPAADQQQILDRTRTGYHAGVPPINEDSMPGTLSNVAAGRIANVFDLAGKNFTTDAACASSLAALDSSMDALRRGECDMVLSGGTDRSMDVTPYVEFSKIGALSPDGSRPFDAGANGFVMGEGCAIFLLKRLSDAERDGDKVYAVLRGMGGSSDGKGKGITAPNPAGQVKAVLRAYQDAEVDPATVGYLEAHGTSTPVGDPVELTSAEEAFRQLTKGPLAHGSIAVGSVKSNMGHLKSAAGAAGLLKVALALKTGELPPSINVQSLNPRIDWAKSPFKVQTLRAAWPRPANGVRRAAVSSFGFGGTNFHMVVEEHIPGHLKVRPAAGRAASHPVSNSAGPAMFDRAAFQAHMKTASALEAEAVVLDGASAPQAAAQLAAHRVTYAETGDGPRLRDVLAPATTAGTPAATRVAFSVASVEDIPKKLEQAQKALGNPAQARLAFQQGVFMMKGKPAGKVAFLFPGQGTQYVNMMRDLAAKYEVVRNTFEEADAVLMSELEGVKLTDILWPTPDTPETQAASEKKLQLTEYTQPAVLAADVAMLRLLRQWGIEADVVAGHSLGEYGALVAAGVLTFSDALHAVAARGREMAHVEVPDLGKMASVSGDWHSVESALKGMTEYVIPANKNCPSQTVIAGSSKGVDEAVKLLQAKGLQAQFLPVSAAFHSAIVAPASKPLRNVLARLDVKAPRVRVLSNVGTEPYHDDPEWIRDNLSTQVASPVEWIGIIERMYNEGVRTFIEVGPKLALTNFVRDILKEKPDAIAIGANHPKKGGIVHVNELFAFLGAWGFQPKLPALDDPSVYTSGFRDPKAAFQRAGTTSASATGVEDLARQVAELRAAVDQIRGGARPAPTIRNTEPTERKEGVSPGSVGSVSPAGVDAEVRKRLAAFGFNLDDIGVSGISVGLPGTNHELFAPDNWDRVLRGENLIDTLPEPERKKIVAKNVVRLQKGGDGSAHFQVIRDIQQVIQLAGRRGGFDMASYGVEGEFGESLDRTFQYAIAAGIEALRDAGIPLQRSYQQTSQGGWLPKEWKLPEPMRDETGIIFASAFPGYDNLLRDVSRFLADKYAGRTLDELQTLYNELIGTVADDASKAKLQDFFDAEFARLQDVLPEHGAARYEFNRKFLFNVLSMGHSQLAQFIGARGPNTQVNAACASTTQAIAIGEDWIRTGRAKRVLVVGADDVTSDAMFEWIGAGFLASGAATTKSDVTQAALPFDKRRHGMIVGMGAVGLVLEATPEVTKRGMRPIAKLLATRVSNSAFHGSRLDVEHIAGEMRGLLASAGAKYGITSDAIAAQTVFMSHETYTPARGGSASAEIHALRATFGTHANKVVVANTKGFTGHPQGAGIEDAIVLKCLQRGKLPPIANFKEPDPELGDLNLSKGGDYPQVRYALRLAAGFGSQVAMSLTELVARETERVADAPRYSAWLSEVSGMTGAKTEVVNRTLRIVDQGPPAKRAAPAQRTTERTETTEPKTVPLAAKPSVGSVVSSGSSGATVQQVLDRLIQLVAEKTGYPKELLDPNLDMEADLGIDTVKQAEIFGMLREIYGVAQDDSVQIKDYNTLAKVAGYMHARSSGSAPVPVPQPPNAPNPSNAVPQSPAPLASSAPPSASAPSGDVLAKLIELVSQKTGYPKDLLDPNLDMEADLGIDTVKQAELFGAIREAYGLPQEEGIQIKDYPSLAKVAGYVTSRLGGAPSPTTERTETAEPKPVPAAAAPLASVGSVSSVASSGASSLDPAAVLEKVIAMVAAKTGYPADMLEPDLDMEADLGIDTVKQAELFGEVRATYNIPMVEGLLIKDYPTLRKVAGFVLANSGASSAPAATSAPAAVAPTVAKESGILRRVPVLRAESLPNQRNAIQAGATLVLGDSDTKLLHALQAAGLQPSAGTPHGLVFVANNPGDVNRVGTLFDAAKTHRAALKWILVVTRQDGGHGLLNVRDAGMAALAGCGKSLKKEFPDAVVKVVDLAPGLDGGLAVSELLNGGKRTEVAYNAEGTRFVIDVAPEALATGSVDVAQKGIIVSGGAQGITVELLAALAPQKPRLLLLGRTDLPAEATTWAALDEAGWKKLEAETVAAMKAKGEKVTPVTIQKAMSPMQKAAEVQRNLKRLLELGAEVLYAPVDVTDAPRVAEAVAWARGIWGKVDGVLHAAGVEISKDLSSKDRAQFDQVYGIKQKGWEALLAATHDDRLSFVAAFGSVAGRFGNLGQTDYAAANEYLAKAVKMEATRRHCNGFTIAWGPWGEVGMATKGSILQIMHASGVTPIPTVEGVKQFLAELATPGVRESVVAGALGAIDADGQVVSAMPAKAVSVPELAASPSRFRLLERVTERSPTRVVAEVHVDQARDAYLRDHKVDGVPYFPGVFGVESFAEAASLLAAGESFLGAQDVKFASPLKQLKAAPVTATLTAELQSTQSREKLIHCTLTTQFVGPDGKPVGAPRLHFEAVLRFGPGRPMERGAPVTTTGEVTRFYPPFFHGPSFQVLASAGPTKGPLVARFRDPTEHHFAAGAASYLSHPMVSEAIFQACGLKLLLHDQTMALPAGIDRIDILQPAPLPGELYLVAHPAGKTPDGLWKFDGGAVDKEGRVWIRMTGYTMITTGPAPPMPASSPAPAAPTSSAAAAPSANGHAAKPKANIPIPSAPVALPQSEDIHFAAITVEDKPADPELFAPSEIAKHKTFTVPKRAQEWRAGRLAAKRAVLELHPELKATDIEVYADEGSGRPRLVLKGREPALWISITHREGLAVAAVSPAPLGIDLETFEDRTRSFLEEAFAVAELKALLEAADPKFEAACMWAAKEAALKRAGVGLKADLRKHIVTADNNGGALVEGPTGRFGIRFYDMGGRVLAVSHPSLDPDLRATTGVGR